MNILGIPILTFVTFFPLAGMLVVLCLPGVAGAGRSSSRPTSSPASNSRRRSSS